MVSWHRRHAILLVFWLYMLVQVLSWSEIPLALLTHELLWLDWLITKSLCLWLLAFTLFMTLLMVLQRSLACECLLTLATRELSLLVIIFIFWFFFKHLLGWWAGGDATLTNGLHHLLLGAIHCIQVRHTLNRKVLSDLARGEWFARLMPARLIPVLSEQDGVHRVRPKYLELIQSLYLRNLPSLILASQ